MLALLTAGGKEETVERIELCGLPALFISLAEYRSARKTQRKIKKIVRLLQKQRVRHFIPSSDFPHSGVFLSYGMEYIDPLPLYRQFGEELVLREIRRQGKREENVCVAIIGGMFTKELRRAAIVLAEHVRYIVIDSGENGRLLAADLRRVLGVPVIAEPTREQIASADVCLCYSYTPAATHGVIPLYEVHEHGGEIHPILAEVELRLKNPQGLADLPEGFPMDAVLAALYEKSAVSKNEMEVVG